MAKDKPPTYTASPELPSEPDLRRRVEQILAVIGGTQTVSQAARDLAMSRNHFQTVMHRGIAALIEAVTPKPAGRPAKPEREAALEAENAKLRAQLETLQDRYAMIERMMSVVSGIASGKQPLPRSRSKKTKPEDPEPAPTLPDAVKTMREAKMPTKQCSQLLGISESTVRRHAKRKASATSARRRSHEIDETKCQRVREIVRSTHGLAGAGSLGRMSGLSRRICAGIKRHELREMEHERKARCASVTIAAPGIVRGFDAMHVQSEDCKAYWLVAADATVPYRTSIVTVPVYDAAHVMAALVADFETHGAPLVLRLDRIACQRTPEVYDLLTRYQVIPLHGPPRHPLFYGQLERQNREHRAWYDVLGLVSLRELAAAGEAMRQALNALWSRPTLDGCTAEQVWERRKPLAIDRRELVADVSRRTSGLVTTGVERLRAQRIAIESALTERGLLTINQGGWC
jgi:hypothetical protein